MPDRPEPHRNEVIITEALERRPSRAPDFAAENSALASLAEAMGDNPESVLQRLVETAMELTGSDSAGISLLEPGGKDGVFRWAATAGAWEPYRGGTMPREESPCGEVVAGGSVLLVSEPARAFPALLQADPAIREALLAPFHIGGEPAGTVWVIRHAPGKGFEKEDARLLRSLARFASVAHRVVQGLEDARTGQAALRESEGKYRALFETMGQGYVLAETVRDAHGRAVDMRLLEVNPAYERLMGVSAEQARGRGAYEILAGVDRWWLETCDRIARAGQPERVEHQYNKDGGWFEAWVYPRGEDRYEVLFENITERKRAESKLRANEARLRLILESMSDAVYVGTEQGIDVANAAALEQLGYDSREELNRHIGKLADEIQTRDFLTGSVISAEDQAFARALAGEDVVQEVLVRNRKSAQERVLRCAASPLIENGKVVAAVAVNTDITALKDAESVLRESDERHAFLLRLDDAMRAEASADRKIEVAARLVGEKLGASRVLWAEYDWTNKQAHIFNGWFADGAQPFPAVMQLDRYEGEVLQELKAGRTVRVNDVASRSDEPAYAAIAELGVQALLSPPLLVDGLLKVNLSIHQHERRHWTDDEVALVQDVAERLWAEVQRARTEAALRESERHQRLLLAELQHRVRNTLAVVRSIGRRTADNSTSVEQMIAHFQGRLDAFSRVQSAVTRSAEGLIDLASMIEDEMVAHAAREGEQLHITGPAVALDARTAERLSLAVHELITNAVKHGGLMRDEGKVSIDWLIEPRSEGDMLEFHWRESGVEIDVDAPRREGFGMELLLRSLPYDLQAESRLQLDRSGLRYELRIPLARRAT